MEYGSDEELITRAGEKEYLECKEKPDPLPEFILLNFKDDYGKKDDDMAELGLPPGPMSPTLEGNYIRAMKAMDDKYRSVLRKNVNLRVILQELKDYKIVYDDLNLEEEVMMKCEGGKEQLKVIFDLMQVFALNRGEAAESQFLRVYYYCPKDSRVEFLEKAKTEVTTAIELLQAFSEHSRDAKLKIKQLSVYLKDGYNSDMEASADSGGYDDYSSGEEEESEMLLAGMARAATEVPAVAGTEASNVSQTTIASKTPSDKPDVNVVTASVAQPSASEQHGLEQFGPSSEKH